MRSRHARRRAKLETGPSHISCIACSSAATDIVVDGVFHKPICAAHKKLYAAKGYEVLDGVEIAR